MMETSLRRAGRALAVVAAGVLVVAAPAHASSTQLSVIEDEHQMLELGADAQNFALGYSLHNRLGIDNLAGAIAYGCNRQMNRNDRSVAVEIALLHFVFIAQTTE